MKVELRYFDDCPNWRLTLEMLSAVMADHGLDGDAVTLVRVESHEKAEQLEFRGSPTILIDGVDPFLDSEAPVGLSCRLYLTETGFAGGPTRAQLDSAIVQATQQ